MSSVSHQLTGCCACNTRRWRRTFLTWQLVVTGVHWWALTRTLAQPKSQFQQTDIRWHQSPVHVLFSFRPILIYFVTLSHLCLVLTCVTSATPLFCCSGVPCCYWLNLEISSFGIHAPSMVAMLAPALLRQTTSWRECLWLCVWYQGAERQQKLLVTKWYTDTSNDTLVYRLSEFDRFCLFV